MSETLIPSAAQPIPAVSPEGSLRFVFFASAVTAIGAFLFGYDTAVINGANTYLQAHFALDPEKDAAWIGLATASAIYGCIPGAFFAGFFSDKLGRRRVLFFCALLYALSAGLSAIPQTLTQFIAARFLSGIANLRADKFVVHKTGPKDEHKLAVAAGALEITFTIDGEKDPVTLTVGALDPNGSSYFAQSNKLPGDVFTLPKYRFEKVKAKPGYFAAE